MSDDFNLSLTERQDEMYTLVMDEKVPNAGFIGGLGSGKTVVGTSLAITMLERYPGCRGLLLAPTYDQLSSGSLQTFLEWCPPNYIARHNRTDHEIEFNFKNAAGRRSLMRYRSTSEIDRIRSHEYSWVWWDEQAMSPEGTLQVVRGRLRDRQGVPKDWHYPIFGTTTPRGRNWLWRAYTPEKHPDETPEQYKSRLKRFKMVHATTYDNQENLPADYIDLVESAMQGDERFRQQEIEGLFVTFEGLVYSAFVEARHVRTIAAPNPVLYESSEVITRFAGVDFGGGDPTALGLYGQGRSGRVHKYAERTWRRPVGLDEIGAQLHKWSAAGPEGKGAPPPINEIWCDPSNQTAIATLRSAGLPAGPQTATKGGKMTGRTINDRGEGIRLCSSLLSRDVFTLNPHCTDSISEYYSYLYKKSTDGTGNQYLTSTPIDHHGDHMDEWRYAMMGRFSNQGLSSANPHLRTRRTKRLSRQPTRVAA